MGNLAWANYPDGTRELRVPDAVGNLYRTEDRRDRKYGPAGQLLEATTDRGVTQYAYDPEGNLIEKQEPSGRIWRYAWGADGMLQTVTRPDGSEVTFEYDALGRRIKKHYRGQTTHFVWDGNVPLHEWVEGDLQPRDDIGVVPIWSHDAAIKRREAELSERLAQGPPARGSKDAPITWLFEAESFAPMARLQGGSAQSIVTDHLGTPVLMADRAGNKTWSASISTWGDLRGLEGDRFACPFRWPGQYEDAETGLYYNRFRYYDPEAGEYVSQDPLGLAGGWRSYSYVSNLHTWCDPYGLSSVLPDVARYKIRDGLEPQAGGRQTGINRAWKQEQALLQDTGEGSRPWTAAQKSELLETGKVSGFTGHHINSVADAPGWKGDPRNIVFLSTGPSGGDHLRSLEGHRGNFQNQTRGRLIDREATRRSRIRGGKCG